MVDINKINSQLTDIKDLDAAQVIEILNKNKNSVIMAGLIIGSLLLGMMILNDYHARDRALQSQKNQAKERIELLKDRDAVNKDLNGFKSSAPKKVDQNELITLISDYAKKYNITINSLSPADTKSLPTYDLTNVSFSGESRGYKDMMFFLREIEKSDSPFRIDSWSGHEDENGKVTFTIDISAVFIHI